MYGSFEARLGAAAGWVSLIGVVTVFILIPMLVAGQPPTVNTEPAAVMAYFRHPEFALIDAVGAFVGIAILPFGYGLRSVLASRGDGRTRVLADLGLITLVVATPIYLVSNALAAMLVQAADGDPAMFTSLFRLYDVLYDSAGDVLEGAWIGAFSIATIWGPLPRWIGWLGIALAASRWVKAFIPVAAVPETIISISGLLFIAWFAAIVVALTRAAGRPAPATLAAGTAAA